MSSPSNDVYFNQPGVASVRWDEAGQVVLVEWEGWANSTEFSALLEAEIDALRKHRCSRILADCRRQRVLNPADQDRANQEWLPRALAAGLKRFAVVVPSSVLADVNLKNSLGKVPATALEVAYFATAEEARDWLG
ncbi:MAG: STAS/SEC14 domain-containing protein [Candidatus Dormibacteraceae bacterium]